MKSGLFYRLLISLVLLFLASTAVMAWLLLDESRNTITEARLKQAHTLAEGLAEGSLDALVVKDYELLERWLKAATPIDDFAYAYLSRADGRVIAHTDVEQVARQLDDIGEITTPLVRDLMYNNRPVREVVHAVWLGNRHMANAHLAYYLDTRPFYSEKIVNRLATLLILSLLTLSVLTYFILRWALAPVENLAGIMAETRNYQPDLPDRLLKRRDEVGLLARNFSELMKRLSGSYRDLEHQATHDHLTGLLNRYEFESHLKQILEQTRNNDEHAVFCYLDIDQFKIINETVGHIAGDTMLREFAVRLQQQDLLPQSAILARLGGDEFGILLPRCDMDSAYKITEAILQMLEGFEFHWDDKSFSVSCSIGVVPINSDTRSSTQLFADADVACYTAKDRGRNGAYFYDQAPDNQSTHSQDISHATVLVQAMQQDRLLLYAQPIADLTRADNAVYHFELLLRLLDENDEIVSAGHLIASAERFGLMPEVDRWVIDNAFSQIKHFTSHMPEAVLSINLSGNSFSENGLADYVIGKLREHDVDPGNICFEITETSAINNLQQATRFISKMRDYGCSFSLDDFGSGLSSFMYLKSLEVDYLKIDGHFVQDMLDHPIDAAMVAAINQVGHSMNIKTIAEFACSEHIVKRLKQMGVDFAQGYAVGKPCAISDYKKSSSLDSTIPGN